MLQFLERRAAAYANVVQPADEAKPTAKPTAQPQTADARAPPNNPTAGNNTGASKKQHFCYDCRQPHQVYECPKFKMLTLKQRRVYVEDHKLCPNCLRVGGHSLAKCDRKPCFSCPNAQKHNQMLCPMRVLDQKPSNVNAARRRTRSNDREE